MEKLIAVENKKQRKQVILEVDLNREDEDLLKKKLYLLALGQKLSNEQTELLETIFGYRLVIVTGKQIGRAHV